MKKMFLACLMVICLPCTALAAPPSFTIDTVFAALDKASKDTDFLFDGSGAEKSCGESACTAKLTVDTDSLALIAYGENSKRVTSIMLFIQLGYKDNEAIATAMLRAAGAVMVMGRLANPKISDADLKKLQNRVGFAAEGLIKGEGKHEVTYKGVHLRGSFVSGVYILGASFGEEVTGAEKQPPSVRAAEIEPKYTGISVSLAPDDTFIAKCRTNLPDGTNISVWLYQIEPEVKPLHAGSPLAENELLILVKKGVIEARFPTAYEKGLPAGKYDISLAIPQLQPNATLGKKNNRLGGPGVEIHANGYKGHQFRFGMKLPRDLNPHPRAPLDDSKKWPSAE